MELTYYRRRLIRGLILAAIGLIAWLLVFTASAQTNRMILGQRQTLGDKLTNVDPNAAPATYTGPTYVDRGVGASGTGTVTPTITAGWNTNDVMLLFVASANMALAGSTAPAGWNLVTNSVIGTGTADGTTAAGIECFWRRIVATEAYPTNPVVADRGNHTVAAIFDFRGCETNGYPFNVVSNGTASSSANWSIPTGNTTLTNVLLVQAITTQLDSATNNWTSYTNYTLGNYQMLTNIGTASGNGSSWLITSGQLTNVGAWGASTGVLNTASVQAFTSVGLRGVQLMPLIITQPIASSVSTGSLASFSVSVEGAAALSYQWQTNGVNVANSSGRWGGTTGPSLYLTNALITDSNTLVKCIITNSFGTVTSSEVALTVTTGGGSNPTIAQMWTSNSTSAATLDIPLTGVTAGALLVVTSAEAAGNHTLAITGGGLTWTERGRVANGTDAALSIQTAPFAAGGSVTLHCAWSSGVYSSVCVYEMAGNESSPAGASATNITQSTASTAITTTRANSLIFCVTSDWSAVDGASRAYRDSATERLYVRNVGQSTDYHYTKAATTATSYTEGLTAPTGGTFATLLYEVRTP